MKRILKLTVLGFAAIAALTSCSKAPATSLNGLRPGIIGIWKQVIVNDECCLTNMRSIKTFFADGRETVSHSKYSESKGGWMWRNKEQYRYVINGNIKDGIMKWSALRET